MGECWLRSGSGKDVLLMSSQNEVQLYGLCRYGLQCFRCAAAEFHHDAD